MGANHAKGVGFAGRSQRKATALSSSQAAFGQLFDQPHGDTAANLETAGQRFHRGWMTAHRGVVELLHCVFQPHPFGNPEDLDHSADETPARPGQQRGGPDEEREADEGNDWIGRLSLLLEHADNLEVVLQIF